MTILTANDLYVAPHMADEFESLRAGLLAEYQPIGVTQIQTLNQLLRAAWDLRRCDDAELTLARQLGSDPLLAPSQAHRHIGRARAQANRDYRQALQELRRQQTDHAIRCLNENRALLSLPAGVEAKSYLPAARAAAGLAKDEALNLITMHEALLAKLQETPNAENVEQHRAEVVLLTKAVTRGLQLAVGAKRSARARPLTGEAAA